MKRRSTRLAIREMQIKAAMWYHYILIRRTGKKKKVVTITNAGESVKKLDHSYIVGRNVKSTVTLGTQFGRFLFWLNMQLSCDPVIIVLGIYLRVVKTCVHINTCSQMFIAALLIVAPNWKQPRCFFTGRMNKLVHPYCGYYSARKGMNYWYKWQLR